MELTSELGGTVLDGLGYLGALASLGGRTAYFRLIRSKTGFWREIS